MKTNILLVMALAMIFLSFSCVQAEDFVFKQNSQIDFRVACYNQGDYCSPAATCYLTWFYPNQSVMIDNQVMSNDGAYHSYNLPDSSVLGTHSTSIVCEDGGEKSFANPSVLITADGYAYSSTRATFYIIFTILFFILAGIALFFGLQSHSMSILVISIMGGLTFIFFAFQMLILNPNIAATNFYDLLIVWFDIYSKIFVFCLAIAPFFILFDLIKQAVDKKGKKDKLRGMGLMENDE